MPSDVSAEESKDFSIEDLDLISTLDITGDEEEVEEKVEKKVEEKVEKKAEEEKKDEETNWFDDLEDEEVRELASDFESREDLIETLNTVQKALGLESWEDWRAGIKDEQLRNHANNFASPADAVKNHFNLRQRLSKALIPPTKESTPAEKKAFATNLSKMLGVPEKSEDYAFPAPPKGEKLTEDQLGAQKNWAEFFHGIHLPKSMAEAILTKFSDESEAGKEVLKKADSEFADKSEAELKGEWGEDYDTNRHLAHHGLRQLFADDFDEIMQSKLSNDRLLMDAPFMLRAFAKIGREMNEGTVDVLSDTEKETIDDQVKDLRARAEVAKSEGNSRLANKLYVDEQKLLAQVVGAQPIVGAGGRTA